MKIFKIIIYVINVILLIHSIHFGIFAILPLLKNPNKRKPRVEDRKHVFRILIAARNEEIVLKPLIKSILSQNYEQDKYQIYVLPNNCTDNTKKIALDLGCNVLEVNFSPKTKGEVLNYAFQKFRKCKDFDTYVIFDADNVLDPNFLNEMNSKLNEGYRVVQ